MLNGSNDLGKRGELLIWDICISICILHCTTFWQDSSVWASFLSSWGSPTDLHICTCSYNLASYNVFSSACLRSYCVWMKRAPIENPKPGMQAYKPVDWRCLRCGLHWSVRDPLTNRGYAGIQRPHSYTTLKTSPTHRKNDCNEAICDFQLVIVIRQTISHLTTFCFCSWVFIRSVTGDRRLRSFSRRNMPSSGLENTPSWTQEQIILTLH